MLFGRGYATPGFLFGPLLGFFGRVWPPLRPPRRLPDLSGGCGKRRGHFFRGSFEFLLTPLASFGPPWSVFESSLAAFWSPLRHPWVPFKFLWSLLASQAGFLPASF